MRIALACTGRLGVCLMKPLLESSHEIVAVLQNGRQYRGLQRRLMPAAAGIFGGGTTPTGMAKRHGIPILWIDKMNEEELAPLRALRLDLLLVGGYSIILKKPILDLPAIGCVNTHSSLLPRHRGPNPFHWIIRNNEAESGVTFHIIDEGIDTGAIIHQASFPVAPDATILDVYRSSCELAADHVMEVVDRIQAEGLHGTPQDSSQATYEKKPTPEDVTVRWDQPARDIERLMRASAPCIWPRFHHRGGPVYLSKVTAENVPADAEPGTVLSTRPKLRIATSDGVIKILFAYRGWPTPSLWPMPWNRPRVGERLG